MALDEPRVYDEPPRLELNQWSLSGDWTVGRQATVLNRANGRIAYRFQARDVNLVMGTSTEGSSDQFQVLIDGNPAGAAHGLDVDEEGNGAVTDARLYQLIRQPGSVEEHLFEISFQDPGLQAYVFTFG